MNYKGKTLSIKNYLAFLSLICSFFIFPNEIIAQNFLPAEEAGKKLILEYKSMNNILKYSNSDNYPIYQEAYALKNYIAILLINIKQGKTTEEAFAIAFPEYEPNKIQNLFAVRPNNAGKLGQDWIKEKILPIIISK